jgi:hypothetical protein
MFNTLECNFAVLSVDNDPLNVMMFSVFIISNKLAIGMSGNVTAMKGPYVILGAIVWI